MSSSKTLDAGHLAARLLAVTLPIGLVLDEVILQGADIHFEGDPLKVSLPHPGTVEVRVSEDSLADFLNKKAPGGLGNFKLTFAGGEIQVEARASLIISLNVKAVCKIVIENETNLVVELVRMESIGGTGAHNIVQKHLDGINPVVSSADLPLDVRFSETEVANHWLVLKGTVAPR